ncbi:MAG: ferritin-like domain-containing protein [Methanobacteriota archaeon]
MVTTQELTEGINRINAQLKNIDTLKEKVNAAIKDEQDAQKMYSDIINTAGVDFVIPKVKRIRQDESIHEVVFKQIITELKEIETRITRQRDLFIKDMDRLKEKEKAEEPKPVPQPYTKLIFGKQLPAPRTRARR